jgi:hypothetical protein
MPATGELLDQHGRVDDLKGEVNVGATGAMQQPLNLLPETTAPSIRRR